MGKRNVELCVRTSTGSRQLVTRGEITVDVLYPDIILYGGDNYVLQHDARETRLYIKGTTMTLNPHKENQHG